MSAHGKESHGKEAEDTIAYPKVIAVGLVSLVIFALATWWSIAILHGERAGFKGREEGRVGSELGKTEIGMVDQVPFSSDGRLDIWKKERAAWVNGYGWIDRAHGIVHMPVDRAMDAIVAGAVPPPPASSTPTPPPAGGTR